jgi:LPS-assembly lipoprotein
MGRGAPSRRRALAALGALAALSACGFSPAHAPDGPATALRGRVLPDTPGDAYAFRFVSQIEERLGRAGEGAPFALGYGLRLATVETAQTGFGNVLRFSLDGTADYTLRSRADGAVLASGRVTAFVTWSDVGTSVAVRSARADAERRLATLLADRVATRLVAAAAGADWAA